ncbi:hypothetical protein [Nostoc sp. WHI]|uniref:hypothetical protein n=1 Tax=Nostoc sp. WHI TaxID=2650611 RepID=UPI0018C638AC|nr:hypothetical protein [Nostoc sp. WHI]MBG1268269.1 hypothetical protein [Nostoc sp. WHI]
MTNQNCPKCESTRTNYQENYGYWECLDCGYVWADDGDDPDYEEESLDLGTCCGCGCTGETVQNLVMLQKKAPVPGTGWGCVVCGVPSDGAVAVVCNDCLARLEIQPDVIKEVVYGYATEKKRYSLAALTEFFDHKDILHG